MPNNKIRYEIRNLGDGTYKHPCYEMPIVNTQDFWANVTDVPCPVCPTGTIRWNEAGYVPGSRICDKCGRFFQAIGSLDGKGRESKPPRLMRDARFDRRKA